MFTFSRAQKHYNTVRALSLLVLSACTSSPEPRDVERAGMRLSPPRWSYVGAGALGKVISVRATANGTVFVGTDTGGLHVSYDYGRSFANISHSLPTAFVRDIAVSESGGTPAYVYLATDLGVLETARPGTFRNLSSMHLAWELGWERPQVRPHLLCRPIRFKQSV